MKIQLIIILIYFSITIIIGFLARKRSDSSTSFHGAGLGVLMCVAAGTGEWLGGTSTSGVSEYGYLFGISGAWYTIANAIGIVVLAIFFAKLYRSLDQVTVPGILEKYLGEKARIVSSILLIFIMIAVGTSQIIAAGTLGVSVMGLNYNTSVIILGVGFIIYTLAGGMISVGYTNILHLLAMYGGTLLAIFLTMSDVGGISSLKMTLPEGYFNMTNIGMPRVSSWIMASVLGACTAQAGIQPILAARDEAVARKSAFLTAVAVAPFGIFTALLGMVAKAKYPALENAKLALPTLMMDLQPLAGGIVLASILAAILSTVSPIILAAGTMATKDIYQKLINPKADDKQMLKVSRLTTGLAGVICIILSLIMYGSTRILDIVYFAYTLRGAIFVVLLFGIYWKGATSSAAVKSLILTTVVGFFWVAYKAVTGSYPIHNSITETYASVITAFISMLLFSKFSKDNHIELET